MNKQTFFTSAVTAFLVSLIVFQFFAPAVKQYLGAEGDSNLTNLVTSGYVTVGGALSVTGAVTLSGTTSLLGAFTNTSSTHVASFVEGGSAVTLTTTSTLTGTQVCQSNPITIANTTATIALTLPAATSTNAVANCLTTDGDFLRFVVLNNGTNTVNLATSTGDLLSGLTLNATSVASFALSNSTGTSAIGVFTLMRVNSSTNQYFFQTYNKGQ